MRDMTDIQSLLSQLISSSGLSGYEAPVRHWIEEAWRPLTNECSVSRLGSLYGYKKSNFTPPLEPCPSILLATHMDAVGLMACGLTGSFIRITEIGGLDPRVLPGQEVIVHGREDVPGLLVQPPDHLLPEELHDRPIPLEYLLVDTGLPETRLKRLVHAGDLVSFAQPPVSMGEGYLAGHSMDNRASVAALTHCLDILQTRIHAWDVWAVATVQEEETFAGAYTSAYELNPDLAIAIDVTFAKGGGDSNNTHLFPLGEGLTIGLGANIHPAVFKKLKELCEKLDTPYHTEVSSRHSGTDAYALQVSRKGIPTAVVSIPLRYMHTVVELVALKDIERVGRLVAEFITSLKADSLKELLWDE